MQKYVIFTKSASRGTLFYSLHNPRRGNACKMPPRKRRDNGRDEKSAQKFGEKKMIAYFCLGFCKGA